MLVFLFIVASASLALPVTNAASNCSKCGLDDKFNDSNGYSCFNLNDTDVACTCPNLRYKLNEPCRICDPQKKICGDDPNSYCVEPLPTSLGVQTNTKEYFACFCIDFSYVIGGVCPSTATTTTTPIAPTK